MNLTEIKQKYDRYLHLNYTSKGTITSYKNCFWRFSKDNTRFYRLSKTDIESYLIKFKSKYSASYYNQMLSSLYILYSNILSQPFKIKGLKMIKQPDTLQNVLSLSQVKQRLSKLNNFKHKALLSTLYLTGMRVSELVNLQLKHLDLTNSRIKIVGGKGNKDRYVPLTRKLIRMLRKYLVMYSPKVFLFEGTTREQRYSTSSIRSICKSIGINNPHLLRHSIITHLIDQGDQQSKVQAFAGHKSPRSTQKYYHIGFNSLNSLSLPS